MSSDDETLRKTSLQWVRDHKDELFTRLLTDSQYDITFEDTLPAASFMAGTPGAGKTELSKRFIEQFVVRPVRIDADEFRLQIPGYTGKNSDVIQPAASLAVDKLLEKVFQKKYSFLLDGTFAIGKAVENLKRADRRNYSLQIFFVYQDPVQAWEFTKFREKKEGRYVPKNTFINAYFAARENVVKAKRIFGDKLTLFLIVKDYVNDTETVYDNVQEIDTHLERLYTREELERLLQ